MDSITVLLPHGPTIMVHKGWDKLEFKSATHFDRKIGSPRDSRSSAQMACSNLCSPTQWLPRRRYKFITSTRAAKNGPETLRTIRRHVRKGVIGDSKGKTMRKQDSLEARGPGSLHPLPKSFNLPFDNQLLAPSTSYSEYPVDMQPHTHALLSKYLTYASSRMFPIGCSLQRSPLKSPDWFHFAATDAAMFHAMLYAAAMYLALLQGRPESKDTLHHQNQTLSILQERLGTLNRSTDDATLGAISCLAIGGAISGNLHVWRMHMKGLKQMMHARGNFSSLTPLLQAKLRRSDVTGAIDYGVTPYLDLPPSPTPPTWSILPATTISQTSSRMASLLNTHLIQPSLSETLTSLSLFTQTLISTRLNPNTTLSPEAFSNDLYNLEHSLLSFPSNLASPAHESALSASLRFSALIYLKAVLQEFPHSINGSKILVEKVREGLSMLRVGQEIVFGEHENEKRGLVTWICIVCAAVSKGEVREWFVSRLASMDMRYEQANLEELLGLNHVFGQGCIAKIWEEVRTRSRTMMPEIYSVLLSTGGLSLFF